jgi:signal transduction histidine kinase
MMGLQYYIITHFVTSVLSLVTGFVVFWKDRRKILNITYFLLALSVSAWGFSYSIWLLQNNPESALFWARTLNLCSSLIPVFYLHWILSLLKINKKKLLVFFYFFTFVFLLFGYSNYFISGTKSILQFPYFPQANWMYIFWLVFGWGGAIIYTFSLLINNIKKVQGNYRLQLIYVLVGSAVGFLGGTTNHFLMLGFSWFPPFGSPLAGLYPLVFAFAMVKHRLMDIKLVMRRYSVHLASLGIILIIATTIKYFIELYYTDYSIWFDVFILLCSISVYPDVKNYFYRLANKYFFSSLYDSSEVIATLSEKLRSTLEAERIYEYIYQTLSNAFHIKAFGVLTYEKNNVYIVRYNQGFKVEVQTSFPGDEALHKMFVEQNKIIITEEVKRIGLFEGSQMIDLFLKMKVEILAPLNVKDKTIGLIVLGAKESGDMYNEEDLKVLEVVGAQAAISLENALLYEETKNFNIKLEKEVEKATRDLRRANTQLKKLDAAKSEFISIASHQLRTPLTVIKGYISMMLEGNFGTLTKLEEESLDKVFQSNERLIQLVENLLNISRIESGRLQFDFHEVDLNEMVESVIDELSGNAKKKGLILQYKAPPQPLPKIKIDDEKIRQVVMNLIDNAIKYTKQGSVTVKLEQIGKKIKFSVADSGMGIRPEDMVNLFKKFSRGTGTSLVHTEGTGLGLYVARMMISAHKGKIWAESDGEGKGSKFCFELPAK